ncbi:MAG: alanine--tRNA ligase [Clostridiales bacterium]|nr:alanine--tRNA ligase [Clostridiales bacterium]
METYGVNELRKMFLDFFESKGHLVANSFPLVPQNDNSLLLINAGMAPLKPYFTGQEKPPRTRMATCQKCIRTGDIDNVGKTARHGTFFEMLGNFSFGDYFKEDAITWCWEFLTKVVGLDPERLYPSVYLDDDEAFKIWEEKVGIPADRIFRFGKEDNFWEHGAGPCGPCSEVYYDRGAQYGCGKPGCTVGCDCDRYVEIWNNVFTQFEGDGKGNYTTLENKNIDTGMGLERLAAVVQGVPSIFDVDTVKAVRDKVCELSGKEYKGGTDKDDVSIRVITDHVRSVTFMISDGVTPSNEGRGYVLRRLLRRACRHGRLLGIQGLFLTEVSEVVIENSKDAYPELEERRDTIFKLISQEEEQFNRTVDQGLKLLSELEEEMKEKNVSELSGEEAFKLYDTFGFPLDLTVEVLAEKGFTVDEAGFAEAMKIQKDTARNARKESNYMGADATVFDNLDESITSEFVGYCSNEYDSEILILTKAEPKDGVRGADELTDEITEGMSGVVITAKTPFYATSGGQETDTGVISSGDSLFTVEEVKKLPGGRIGHFGKMTKGSLSKGEVVHLAIDVNRRLLSGRNHSATHLLQAALREVLGNHVAQKGSVVDQHRLRFDFTHFAPMTQDEIARVEAIVNEKIAANLPVVTEVMALEDAKKTGANALFSEKYGSEVRVVSMGDFSKELCGGTHVPATGTISQFKIISEAGISAGVRRIEALTSDGAKEYYDNLENELHEIAKTLKTQPDAVLDRINHLLAEVKELSSENESLKSKLAQNSLGDVMDDVKEVKGVKLLAAQVSDVDMNGLRNLGDQFKEKLGEGVVVLACANEGKVNLMVTVTEGVMKKGAHAGNLIKNIASLVGGGGGGRPNMAQAGGKNPDGIPAALAKAEEVLSDQLK